MRTFIWIIGSVLLLGTAYTGYQFVDKYRVSQEMRIPIEELTATDYPADPSRRGSHYDQYVNRFLRLVKKDETHFDFIFQSDEPDVATVVFKDIDLSLFIPSVPSWAKADPHMKIITLVEKEWNRQQISLDRSSPNLTIEGGDGFEKEHLFSAEISRNCLNAGLWEVLFYSKSDGKKQLYYHGWFKFPLGHYKDIFEKENGESYWSHWYRLEHWWSPKGSPVHLEKFRDVVQSNEVWAIATPNEPLLIKGEQERKRRILSAMGVKCFGDICKGKNLQFASFVPPGRYDTKRIRSHKLHTIAKLDHALLRKVKSKADHRQYDEIELVFKDSKDGNISRFIVSGIDFTKVPRLPKSEYPKGLYMPMGIAVPPFYQSYEALKKTPPKESVYFSLLLDKDGKWIDHHEVGIDGPIIHRDLNKSDLIHIYFLSYERLMLVGHYVLKIPQANY
ncbi:MAG: hypothetical protein WD595_01590 [Waddliaceae bacterium]